MFYPWENLALGGCVALQFVGDEHLRDIRQPFEELAKEFLRGPLIPAALHQDIEHVSLLIDGSPQIVTLSFDRQKHFIQVPLVPRPWTATPELISILLAKLATPLANGF